MIDMTNCYGNNLFGGLFSRKNWENGISRVCVEACDCAEDPLGYRAVYYIEESKREDVDKTAASFVVGASFLVKREDNLKRSGYNAPMTRRAISLIENSTGLSLAAAK
jgi:hypothetical protein